MAEKKIEKQQDAQNFVVGTRGRSFQGTVTKIFGQRAVIEFQRTVKVEKYERFMRKKTRLHSRIPDGMKVSIGDYVKVQECRPLSKMIHSVVIEILKKNTETKK